MSRLIDADALMMDLEKWMKQVDPTHPQEDNAIPPLEDIIVSTLMTIEEQPTVDAVERKKGKWVLHPEVKNIYGGIYIECSECHTKYVVQHIEDEKYCRNCGADMRKGEEE